jgi:putative membrane protein
VLQYPYERFRERDLSLNDYLAVDRTELANERTLLAYVRTAIALLITGVSAIKFFASPWITATGVAFIAAATLTVAIGWRRYRQTNQRLATALRREADKE